MYVLSLGRPGQAAEHGQPLRPGRHLRSVRPAGRHHLAQAARDEGEEAARHGGGGPAARAGDAATGLMEKQGQMINLWNVVFVKIKSEM